MSVRSDLDRLKRSPRTVASSENAASKAMPLPPLKSGPSYRNAQMKKGGGEDGNTVSLRKAVKRQFSAANDYRARSLALIREKGPGQAQFWVIALIIGIAAGFAALFFRLGIERLQAFLYGTDDVAHLHSFAETLPWFLILVLPAAGG